MDLLKALKKENRLLKQENRACKAQGRLFELLIEMAGSASEQKMLKVSMQKTLEVTARLSGAKMGSLFLLNQEGVVTDSLLTRGEVSPNKRLELVGSVIDKGLAGWVRAHLEVGVIKDTQKDARWLSLPEEPYVVRSALAVPIIKHKSLFGIVTLMHPFPHHFNQESIEIVQIAASHMALAIESAQLYIKLDELHHLRQKAMERDLKLARTVQESFLPARVPGIDGYSFAAMNRPALEVGGGISIIFSSCPGVNSGWPLGMCRVRGLPPRFSWQGSAVNSNIILPCTQILENFFQKLTNSFVPGQNRECLSPWSIFFWMSKQGIFVFPMQDIFHRFMRMGTGFRYLAVIRPKGLPWG